MTGKLFLADGENYGFYPRRARAVAEVADYVRKNGLRVLGTAVPEIVNIGDTVTLAYTGTAPKSFEKVPAIALSKADVLEDLAVQAIGEDDVAFAARLEGDIGLVPVQGVSLSAGSITYVPAPATAAALGAGETSGPYSSTEGFDFWIQRSQNGRWFVAWDIDSDPGADLKIGLRSFLAGAQGFLPYQVDVRLRAEALGWPK